MRFHCQISWWLKSTPTSDTCSAWLEITTCSCSSCPICKADFGTRARGLQHLVRSTRCALWAASLEPMTQAEIQGELKHSRKRDTRHTRMLVPRRGPNIVTSLASPPASRMVAPKWIDGHPIACPAEADASHGCSVPL
eukprot:444140-Amphidinium_carterae.1